MAYARSAIHPREFSEARKKSGRTFWQRLLASMVESRQRAAEREIGIYLRNHGGKFTDEAERDIERLLSRAQF